MNKINYPKNTSSRNELDIFEKDYIDLFPIKEMQRSFKKLYDLPKYSGLSSKSIKDILVMDFEGLYALTLSYSTVKPKPTDDEITSFKKIFNYDIHFKEKNKNKKSKKIERYQPKISQFFVQRNKLLNIKSCFFCNLEFINSFTDVADYLDFSDFINNAPKEDLEKINGVGPKLSSEILDLRIKLKGSKFINESILRKELPKRFLKCVDDLVAMEFKDELFYFTLDHVIDKGNNPITSLSLYNLVPCCSLCNSKFKSTRSLVRKKAETNLSPSSKNFNFSDDNKFKMFFRNIENRNSVLKSESDFSVRLEPERNAQSYKHYEKLFKLNARYKEHKEDVFELFNKKIKYPDSKIKQMADLFKYKMSDIQEEVFGKNAFSKDLTSRPKAKLMTDIAKQIGISKTSIK